MKRETLLREIITIIRSSLDINEIKKNIVSQIGQAFNADRCFIRLFDPVKNEFLPLDEYSEYLSSPEIKSIIGLIPDKKAHEYIKMLLKQGKDNIIYDIEEKIQVDKKNTEALKSLKNIYDIKSDYGIQVYYGETYLGAMVLHYIKSTHHLNAEDIKFLKYIADQIGVSLYHARLYETAKKTVGREKLLRKTIEKIRSTLDLQEIKTYLVNTVASYFNADRCYIVEYDPEREVFLPITTEYTSSPDLKSILHKNIIEEALEFVDLVKGGTNNIIMDSENFIEKNKETLPIATRFLKNYKIKSDYGLGIFYKNIFFGALVIHFVKDKKYLIDDELNFLEFFTNQAGVAIYQAELYEKEKQTVEREKFLAEITSILESTLDIEEILALISKKIEKFYRVENVIIDLNSAEKIRLAPEKNLVKEDLILLDRIANNISIAVRDSNLYTRSKFMADISHELRTPIAIIDGYVNNLLNKQDYAPEIVDKYLNIIKKNTIRIINIIENLRTLSRLENREEENGTAFEEISAENLIKNVLQLQENNKKIIFETRCDSSITLQANEILLEQALLNLIKNAVLYSSEDSKVIIKAQKTENRVAISVQDFGCGIEKHHLKNVFKRFYRADRSRSRETGGSGLGLSIVENIVKAHNGKVSVKSEENRGSTFTIEIPCF